MWYQTLKTRQTVKRFTSANSNDHIVAIEYSDKKVDVHMLKREMSPLSLDEGTLIAFVSLENGGMCLVGVSLCGKGRSVLEFKAWDVMNALGFTAREVLVQDMQRLNMNEGKFKGIVNLPDLSGNQHTVKIDALMDYFAVSIGPGLVLMWRCKKTDTSALTLELVAAIEMSMTVQDIALILPEEESKNGLPCVVIGEPGGVQVLTATKSGLSDPLSCLTDGTEIKFSSTLLSLPTGHLSSAVQDIRRSSTSSCILSDNFGSLWYLTSSTLSPIHLPSSNSGHGVFAVQSKSKTVPEGWLATVQKNQTINLYKLDEVIKHTNTELIVQPWHLIFSACQLNCVSFIDSNTLAAGSPSNRTLSLWAGLDCLGRGKGG